MPSTTTPSRKRKAEDDENILAEREALAAKMEEIEIPEGSIINSTPNQIRNRIRRLIESGEVGVGEFCDTIGVSQAGYRRFMGQNGHHGYESDTFSKAWEYFEKRSQAGVHTHLVAKRTKKDDNKKGKGAGGGPTTEGFDVTVITLDGEAEDNVEIYDSCNEIRRKIGVHLRRTGVTRAQFCRDLSAQFHEKKRVLSSTQLTTFQNKKGANMGATSSVFYAAYVFFEKQRIHEKKPMSKHRQQMEEIWGPRGGFDTSHDGSRAVLGPANARPVVDQYGRYDFYTV